MRRAGVHSGLKRLLELWNGGWGAGFRERRKAFAVLAIFIFFSDKIYFSFPFYLVCVFFLLRVTVVVRAGEKTGLTCDIYIYSCSPGCLVVADSVLV